MGSGERTGVKEKILRLMWKMTSSVFVFLTKGDNSLNLRTNLGLGHGLVDEET